MADTRLVATEFIEAPAKHFSKLHTETENTSRGKVACVQNQACNSIACRLLRGF